MPAFVDPAVRCKRFHCGNCGHCGYPAGVSLQIFAKFLLCFCVKSQGILQSLMTCATLLCQASTVHQAGNIQPPAIALIRASCLNARLVRVHLPQSSHLLSIQLYATHSRNTCSRRATKQNVAYTQCSSLAPGQYVIGGRSGDTCGVCSGTTQVQCSTCKGSGKLTKAGYHSRNSVDTRKIVGAAFFICTQTLDCNYHQH